MKKYPLMEMREFLNLAIREKNCEELRKIKIQNYTQFQIVKYLFVHEDEEIYQKDFESALSIRKSTISGILSTMEKNKIIVRLSSKSDARGKIITLSDDLKAKKRAIFKRMLEMEERIVEGITEEELEVFYGVLKKMKTNIEKEGK